MAYQGIGGSAPMAQMIQPGTQYNQSLGGMLLAGNQQPVYDSNYYQQQNDARRKKMQELQQASLDSIAASRSGQFVNQATDPYQLPQGQKPAFSTSNQGPYQMPGGPGQISTAGNPAYDIAPAGPNAGPRPQQPPLAPGQQPYTGPRIGQAFRPNQSAFGQQNPTQYVGPYGQQFPNRGTAQGPRQNQFMNTVW